MTGISVSGAAASGGKWRETSHWLHLRESKYDCPEKGSDGVEERRWRGSPVGKYQIASTLPDGGYIFAVAPQAANGNGGVCKEIEIAIGDILGVLYHLPGSRDSTAARPFT